MTAPTVDALPTAPEILTLAAGSHFRGLSASPTRVRLECPVPGHPAGTYRVVVFTRATPALPWSATCFLRTTDADGTVTLTPLHRGGPFRDALELGLWLGGVASVPVDRAEVDAILRGAVA